MTREQELEEVLNKILNSNKLYQAKELAADILEVDVDDYLVSATDDDIEEMAFFEDDELVDTFSDHNFA